MRLFVAIEVPAVMLPAIEALQFKLRGRGLVRARHPHMTLKFLGEVKDTQQAIDALSKVEFSPFDLTIQEIGFFPNVSNPNVVFLGVKPNAALSELATKVSDALPTFKSDHPFHAHITLFRLRTGFHKARLKDVVRHVKVKPLSFTVSSFVLKQSTLTNSGPVYSDVASFPARE